MKSIKQTKAVNISLLDEQVRGVLGDKCYGVSVRGDEVEIHLADEVTAAEVTQAQGILDVHDANAKTAVQQEHETRQAVLAADRAKFQQEDDLSNYAGQSPLDALAERVRWLEREIRELKGL